MHEHLLLLVPILDLDLKAYASGANNSAHFAMEPAEIHALMHSRLGSKYYLITYAKFLEVPDKTELALLPVILSI